MDAKIKYTDGQIQGMLQELPFQIGRKVYFAVAGWLQVKEFYYSDEADRFFDEIRFREEAAS